MAKSLFNTIIGTGIFAEKGRTQTHAKLQQPQAAAGPAAAAGGGDYRRSSVYGRKRRPRSSRGWSVPARRLARWRALDFRAFLGARAEASRIQTFKPRASRFQTFKPRKSVSILSACLHLRKSRRAITKLVSLPACVPGRRTQGLSNCSNLVTIPLDLHHYPTRNAKRSSIIPPPPVS